MVSMGLFVSAFPASATGRSEESRRTPRGRRASSHRAVDELPDFNGLTQNARCGSPRASGRHAAEESVFAIRENKQGLCQMEILDCKKVPWPSSLIRKVYNVNDCGWPQQEAAYECKINLLTGKTHQIRAQLAAIGTPIVGDSAYMTAAMAAMANPSINPFGRERLNYNSEEEKEAAVEAWIASHGKEPKSVVGLQASEISWDYEGEHRSYKAGVP